jgi:hypothetical protein
MEGCVENGRFLQGREQLPRRRLELLVTTGGACACASGDLCMVVTRCRCWAEGRLTGAAIVACTTSERMAQTTPHARISPCSIWASD